MFSFGFGFGFCFDGGFLFLLVHLIDFVFMRIEGERCDDEPYS